MDLQGKRVVITGAGRGLGKPMALACLKAGAKVLLTSTDRASLEETAAESGAGSRAAIYVANVLHPDQVLSIAKVANETFGGVDVLINNAGIGTGSIRPDFWENPIKFWTIDDEGYRKFIQINLLAPLKLASLFAPEMIARKWGRIVNVTTSLSTMLMAGQAPYSISKPGLEAVTSVMAGDLNGTGVTANVLAPGGPADTRMLAGMNVPREALIPADCMAISAVWLSSNDSDGVTAKRFLGVLWDTKLPPAEAAKAAMAPVAWTGFGVQMKPPTSGLPPRNK